MADRRDRARRRADTRPRRPPREAERDRARRAAPPREPRPKRGGGRSDLLGRVLVAIPLVALVVALAAAGGIVWTLFMIVLGLLCLHELFALLSDARPARLAALLAMVGLALAAHYGDQRQVLLVYVATLPVAFLLAAAGPARSQTTLSIATTMLGVSWIGLAFAHAVLLRDLPHGDGIVIDVLVGTFVGDTGAYFGGRMFGQRPLAPRLSPNKTVEGLVIGVLFGIAGVWFAGLYQDWLSGGQALLIGLGVALAAPLGDLFESAIKRDAGAKDTGRIFGPHGGVLDRLDAALFSIVVGYYIWLALL